MINNADRSLFKMLTGPRGSLKTLLLTSFQVKSLLRAHYSNHYLGTNKKVWTNYPVSFRHFSMAERKHIELSSTPLNREALMMFDEEYCEGDVYIDEFDQWYDKQDWQDAGQKLTAKAITQIRKKKLSLAGTMQNINWANGRLEFQVDIHIECREAAFLPFGRKHGLDFGECAMLKWKDMSGLLTGYTFDETKRTYDNMFWGKRYWHCYDTNFTFDPTESMTRYKFKRNTKIIDMTGNPSDPDNVQGNLNGNKMSPNLVLFADIIDQYKKQGYLEVTKAEIQKKAMEQGFNGDWVEGGKILSRLGIQKGNARGSKFILEDQAVTV